MSRFISFLLATVTVSATAHAHMGDHGSFSLLKTFYHFLSEPLHTSLLVASVCAIAAGRALFLRRQR